MLGDRRTHYRDAVRCAANRHRLSRGGRVGRHWICCFPTRNFLEEPPVRSSVIVAAAALLFMSVAQPTGAEVTVSAKNNLDIPRPSETVELKWSDIADALPGVKPDRVVVTDPDGKPVVAQPIWLQSDKKKPADELIFQTDFAAGETRVFKLAAGMPAPYQPKVYGRWIPERHDDFAWENDRIAFRIYGPELEIVEPASSGVDVWPKRTHNLIVNQWYQLAQSINDGYYHFDHGEGLDNFKVGHGQGCGGTAILLDGKRVTTGIKGWKTQKILANGPIRLIFDLTYDPIDVNGAGVKETKRVILDAGQNLNHFQSTFTADKPVDTLQIMSGLGEHHDRSFEKDLNKAGGCVTYWDAGDGPGERRPEPNTAPSGYVGIAVVMDPSQVQDVLEIDGQLEMVTKATLGQPVNFWAGAGWDQSGDFKNYQDWKDYAAAHAKMAASPLTTSIKH